MKVSEISAGENHILAVIEKAPEEEGKRPEKQMFVWGSNDKGQLGMETEGCREVAEPHRVDPDPFNDDQEPDRVLLSVAASFNYSAALT